LRVGAKIALRAPTTTWTLPEEDAPQWPARAIRHVAGRTAMSPAAAAEERIAGRGLFRDGTELLAWRSVSSIAACNFVLRCRDAVEEER